MSDSVTTYRLAPALGARLVGRSLVTLGVLVAVATVAGLLLGVGWTLAGGATLVGLLLLAGWAWYLLRRAWALRLSPDGYAVRILRGVGATSGAWSHVTEVVATTPGGTPCLLIRLDDGTSTRLPMPAVAADADALALDVRRRVRDAHTPGGAVGAAPEQ